MSDDRRVLSFAAVGRHGRDGRTRMTTQSFLLLMIMAAAPAAQSATALPGLASELATRIAGIVAPAAAVVLTVSTPDGDESEIEIRDELESALRARGIQALDVSDGAIAVRVSCATNLREHVCLAEIARPEGGRVVAAVTRPVHVSGSIDRRTRLSLEIARLFGQRAPILDIALSGDRLFVLDPAALTLYRRGATGWQRGESRAVGSSRPWPRDTRGRVRINGSTVEAFLPGVICRTDSDLARFSCAEDAQAWPLGIDNSGVDASRNFFSTPEGLPFYAAAPLEPTAGTGPKWLIVDRFGALTFLDGSRRTLASAGRTEDVASISSPCGGGTYVLTSSRGEGTAERDVLQLFRVTAGRLVPAAPSRVLAGRSTALWAAPGATVATIVTHDSRADTYEAFQVGVACDW